MTIGMPPVTADLRSKVQQVEEQLQLAMQEYPERLAIERLKFALALTKFVRSQIDFYRKIVARAGVQPQ